MLLDRSTTSRKKITADAHFNRNLFLRQITHQLWIFDCTQSMPNAVGLQLAQRAPNGFRPKCLSSMDGQSQSVPRSVFIYLTKLLGSCATLVAAQTNSDHVTVPEANGFLGDAQRVLDSEVTSRVEDPIQRNTKVTFAALPSSFRTFKQWREFLSSPLHHARGNVHLGVENVLRMELLHHAIGNELIVLGGAQPLGDRLECPQKSAEVFVAVEFTRFFLGEDAATVFNVAVTFGLVVVSGVGCRRLSSASVSGSTVPSRCRCSSALGREAINPLESSVPFASSIAINVAMPAARCLG